MQRDGKGHGRAVLLLAGLLLIASSAAPLMGARTGAPAASPDLRAAPCADDAPPWAVGCSWTWTADQAVDFCVTMTFTLRINRVTGTITDQLRELAVYNNTPVYRVEGSYSEQLKGVIIMAPLPPQAITIPIVGNTTVYYRISDLAPVYQVGHFNIDMGALGSAQVDSSTDFSPPLEQYRFPLEPLKSWKTASYLTVWNKMTSSSSGYETTTYQSIDALVAVKGALEDVIVPAGTFPSYNLSMTGTVSSGGNSQPFASYNLYSPAVTNTPLRREEPLSGLVVLFGLSSYSLNHAPSVASAVTNLTFAEDTVGTLELGTIFADPDAGDQLAFSAWNNTSLALKVDSGGHVLLTPPKDWSGQENLSFCATDRKGASSRAVVHVTVTPVNDAPLLLRALPGIIMDEDTVNSSLNLSEHFGDADIPYGDRLNLTFSGNGSVAAAIAPDGIITLGPFGNWSGLQNITIISTDAAGAAACATLSVAVLNTPDRPVATCATHEFSTPEDRPVTILMAPRFWDADIPYGDLLEFSVDGLPPEYSVDLDERTGVLNITPPADLNGRVDMTFVATDRAGLNATEPVRLTVTPVNDPPVLLARLPAADRRTLPENTSADFTVAAADIDSRELNTTWFLDGSAAGLGGNFTFSPDFFSAGNHSLLAVISDGEFNISAGWNLTVTNVDRPPQGARILTPANGTRVAYRAAVNFTCEATDADGDTLVFRWKDTDGTVIGVGNAFTTKALRTGRHTITLEVLDGNMTVTDSVVLTVGAPPAVSKTPMLDIIFLIAALSPSAVAARARRQRKD